jgi:hypothetical protein
LQYPDWAQNRGVAKYWNFLPPDELNEVLSLYHKVTKKTLRISKVFGIEGASDVLGNFIDQVSIYINQLSTNFGK